MKFSIETIEKTARFFKLRFPNKDLIFEMECGYFFEWCTRFDSGRVKQYCDQESLEAVLKLENEE